MTQRRLHTLVAVVGIGVAAAAAWWYQARPTGPAAAASAAPAPAGRTGPVVVEVGKVEAATLEQDAQAVGTLRSRQSVMVRPEVSGRVVRLGFSDGQRIRRGQVLVKLDDTLQQAQLQQALAQAGIARTNLERSRELVAQNFVSRSALDQNAAALEVAEAQVALARAQLARMTIRAPFDGAAGIRNVDVGDYLKDGADVVQIEDSSSVLVDFRLPERFIAEVKHAQAVDVTFDALPGRRYAGRVEALDSLVDADGRSLLVRARIDNPSGELRAGMFARTRIVFGSRSNARVVPEEALVPMGGRQFIVKLVEGPNGLVSQRLEAKVGARLPGKVEVLDGLEVGDTVVTAGQAALMRADGLPVRIVEIGRAGPGGAPAPARTGSAV
jgi:membrane fusion protein (multidrug efflux system)